MLIFQNVQTDAHGRVHALVWIVVTWVCRYWRDVALASPILWTDLILPRRRAPSSSYASNVWFPTLLKRAAGAPLDVSFSILDESYNANIVALVPYMSTIRKLKLSLERESEAINALLAHTRMPMLEELDICDYQPGSGANALTMLGAREDAPLLADLRLFGAHFPWSSSIYTSLRALQLDHVMSPPETAQLMRILRECPTLEVLHVHNSFPTNLSPNTLSHIPPVALTSLVDLQLRGTNTELALFTNMITTHPSCTVSTFGDHQSAFGDLILDLLPTQRVFQPLIKECTSLILQMYSTFVCLIAGPSAPRLQLQLRTPIFVEIDPSITPATWDTLMSVFSAAHLTHIRLKHDALHVTVVSAEMWTSCFARFPTLEVLSVGPWGYKPSHDVLSLFRNVLCALRTRTSLGAPPCPRLRTLEATCMTMDDTMVDMLSFMLEGRAALGVKLGEVSLTRSYCRAGMDAVALRERLQRLVPLLTIQ